MGRQSWIFIMGRTGNLLIFLVGFAYQVYGDDHCCVSKTVGEHNYAFAGKNSAVPGRCLNDCTYVRVKDNLEETDLTKKYCFASGDEESTCNVYSGIEPLEGGGCKNCIEENCPKCIPDCIPPFTTKCAKCVVANCIIE